MLDRRTRTVKAILILFYILFLLLMSFVKKLPEDIILSILTFVPLRNAFVFLSVIPHINDQSILTCIEKGGVIGITFNMSMSSVESEKYMIRMYVNDNYLFKKGHSTCSRIGFYPVHNGIRLLLDINANNINEL
jgi:hypothetical protein